MAIRNLTERERQLITGGLAGQSERPTDLAPVQVTGDYWDNPYDVENSGYDDPYQGDYYYGDYGSGSSGGGGGGSSDDGQEEENELLSDLDPVLEEAGKTFLELVEAGIFKGMTPFSNIELALDYGSLSASLVDLTFDWALRDIEYFRQIQGHVPNPMGSLLPWQDMEVDWTKFGADDPSNSGADVLENYFNALENYEEPVSSGSYYEDRYADRYADRYVSYKSDPIL